jgi:lipoyl(octanoyl) transferase
MDHVELQRLGRIDYAAALEWQRRRAAAFVASPETAREAVSFLEHDPVYTLGARGNRAYLIASEAELAARGAAVVQSDRGGDVTFHGPGQLVVYPILNVRRRGFGAAAYVHALEEAVIRALDTFGVAGARIAGRRGVWVFERKVAAIGVRISRGISMHGLALNVSTDLRWFQAIVPCGIADAGVTSIERVLGVAPPLRAVEDALAGALGDVLGIELVERGAPALAAPGGSRAR